MRLKSLLLATTLSILCLNACAALRVRSGETYNLLTNAQILNMGDDHTGRRSLFSGQDLSSFPAWRGRIDTDNQKDYFAPAIAQNRCDDDCDNGDGWSYPYDRVVVDPTNSSSNQPVIQVLYPANSVNPSDEKPGGTSFHAYPYKDDPDSEANPFSRETATLEYEIYFPDDFEWVKGGKLPGLAGGADNGVGCGGGASANSCFSFRLMWRREGAGEAYIYAPDEGQDEEFCGSDTLPDCNGDDYPCNACNFDMGISFYRGSWFWKTGEWQKVRVTMSLNTPWETDGLLRVEIDGETMIDFDRMMWRTRDDVYIEGLAFSTFYGGSDKSWAPENDNTILYRNFRMWRTDSPGKFEDRASIMSAPITKQVVVEKYFNE